MGAEAGGKGGHSRNQHRVLASGLHGEGGLGVQGSPVGSEKPSRVVPWPRTLSPKATEPKQGGRGGGCGWNDLGIPVCPWSSPPCDQLHQGGLPTPRAWGSGHPLKAVRSPGEGEELRGGLQCAWEAKGPICLKIRNS